MQKEIQLTDKTLLVVGLPKEASNIVVDGNGSSTVRLSFYDSGWDWIKLNKGNWQLLGIYPELTEEQAITINATPAIMPKFGYRYEYVSALESFQSLMERERCYTVNPYGKMPEYETQNILEYFEYRKKLYKWQEAQKTTFDKYAILIRSK